MNDDRCRPVPDIPPAPRLLARLKGAWHRFRDDAARRRALRDIIAKPHDHWLRDAPIPDDELRRLMEKRRLHRIAEWSNPRGPGL